MSFLNPWGLLGLIGIPILILIYILRPRFEEKIVTSTFIWKLSLKYKKKNVPLQWLRRSLLFILQLLIIIVLSLMIARPVVKTDAVSQQIVILDGSASMMAQQDDDQTRFDEAVSQLKEQISKLPDGSGMTIIYVTDEADTVISQETSKRALNNAVDNLTCTYADGNMDAAITLAETMLSDNSMAELTIYTDTAYSISATQEDRVSLVNVAGDEWNAAVLSLTSSIGDKNFYTFSSEIASYGTDASLTVALYVDDEYVDSQIVDVQDSQTATVDWDTEISSYSKAEIYIEAQDSLSADNTYDIYNEDANTYQVLIVSDAPTFLKSVLNVVGNCDITVVDTLDDTELTGYDLYVFDGIMPDSMPKSGAVWIFAPEDVPSGLNLTVGTQTSGSFYLEKAVESGSVATITQNITASNIAVSEYTPLSSSDGLKSIYQIDNQSVVLAGEIDNMRVAVFGFDLHNSNLPLLIDFPQLAYNLLSYSLPQMLSTCVYNVGETASIQAVSSSQLITVTGSSADSESAEYYDFPVSYTVSEPGVYQINQTLSDGSVVTGEFFAHIGAEESNICAEGKTLTVQTQLSTDASVSEQQDTESDGYQKELWFYLAILLLILLLIEWEVQYREQL